MSQIIELTSEAEIRLNKLAAQTGRSKAYHIQEMIDRGLEDIEDYYSAHKVLQAVRNGTEKLHSSDDVRRTLGLDN